MRTALFWEGNERILIDCGPDIHQQMREYRLRRPDAVLITHEHSDHYIGLDELVSFRRCLPKDDYQPIPLYATEKAFETIELRFGYLMPSVFEKRVAIPGEPLNGLNTLVIPFKTYHGDVAGGSVGYALEDFGSRLCYTSDFSALPEEPSVLFRPDVLVIQAYWLNEPAFNRPNHMSFQNALAYIRRWAPKSAYLTHIGDQDQVPGDPANRFLKKTPPKEPLRHPTSGRIYPIPLCQEEWERIVSEICRDRQIQTEIHVAYDGLTVEVAKPS
ncbi:MAG: MBL fold metallo-hydrolase [Deltaproteobacteria bacterium]|nr:MBL fold metallo-hydrolase [Deltaproteobacteria bacterium]